MTAGGVQVYSRQAREDEQRDEVILKIFFLTVTNGALSRNSEGTPLVRGRVNAIASNDSIILEFRCTSHAVHASGCRGMSNQFGSS